MNNKTQIGLTLIITGLIFFTVGIFLYVSTFQSSIQEVDCYDRWNNKIIGQTCLEESGGSGEGEFTMILSMILIFIGNIPRLIGYLFLN